MPIRDSLLRIASEYPTASRSPLAGHPLAAFIATEAPSQVQRAIGLNTSDFLFAGSAGKGNWAAVPWIAVFERSITDTATRGYYVVYLFSPDGHQVALSLNQGTTAVIEEFGRRYRTILRERANLMRERLREFLPALPQAVVEIGGRTNLAKGYSAGHAIGKLYEVASLPAEDVLIADLEAALRSYRTLRFRGGVEPTEGTVEADGSTGTITERRKYGSHRMLERASGVSIE